jgi:CxxC motif-containing protein (DUF1111 family)
MGQSGYRASPIRATHRPIEFRRTFLHDGRARSAEEAILWHFGEAGHARSKFVDLGPRARETLLHWLETL